MYSYNRTKDIILIDQQYADDIGWAANNVHNISTLEANITSKIQRYNLRINKKRHNNIVYKEMEKNTGENANNLEAS